MTEADPWLTEGQESALSVVTLGLACVLSAMALDVLLVGELSFFFDLCFVVICLALAVLIRRREFFAVGILPPLMMLGVCLLLAFADRGAVAEPHDSLVQAVVTGLAVHSGALVAGYAVCLGILALRMRSVPGLQHQP